MVSLTEFGARNSVKPLDGSTVRIAGFGARVVFVAPCEGTVPDICERAKQIEFVLRLDFA
jgi:hypothetical protein